MRMLMIVGALLAMMPVQVAAAPRAAATALTVTQRTGVEAVIRAEMKKRAIPGLQIAIVRGGRIAFTGAYGIADLESGARVTPDSVFTLNSSTKAFTGVAIMQLVQDGRVSLDAPVSRYLDDLPAAWRPVTIRQLLTHVSGLPDVLIQSIGQGTGSLVGSGAEDDAWRVVRTMPIEATPGVRFRYNQTNYVLLGKIIDHVAGRPFTRFMADRQFVPAGMRQVAFGEARDVVPHRVRTYRYAGGNVTGEATNQPLEHAFDEFAPFMRTAGGLNASAGDVASWIVALQDGRLLRPDMLRRLWTPGRFADGTPTQWGMGWPLRVDGSHPVATGIGGRRSAFFVYPDDDLAIVVLTNLAGANPEEFIGEIAGQFYPDMLFANGGGLPPPVKRLRLELLRTGFADGDAAVARLRAADPAFRLDEDDLNQWGGRLLQAGNIDRAIGVFTLNTHLHAASANTWDSLAEAYEAQGDKAAAIANYDRSLTLDRTNGHAAARLAILRKP